MIGWMKKAGALCLTAALAVAPLTSCYTYYDLELYSKPTMSEISFDEETGLHTILVEGLVQNITGEQITIQVDAYLYDEYGDNMASGTKKMPYAEPGEIWHYYVLIKTEDVPTDFEVEARYY